MDREKESKILKAYLTIVDLYNSIKEKADKESAEPFKEYYQKQLTLLETVFQENFKESLPLVAAEM